MELKQVLETFDQHLAALGRKASTRLAYRTDLGDLYKALQDELGREPQVDDLTRSFMEAYLTQQAAKQRRSTLLRRVASLRAFERYLVERYGVAPFMPDRQGLHALLEKSQVGRVTPCLTTEQLLTLWRVLVHTATRRAWRDLALMALLLEWGFPTERIIHLEMADVDLKENRVRVRAQGGIELWFPIKYALGPLQYYLEFIRYQYNLPEGETRLFVSQLGRPLSRQSIWQSLGAWGRVVGFDFTLTPRVLRNTAALRLWRLGTPRDLIQQALGHTNPISTMFLLRRVQQTCGEMPIPKIPLLDPKTKEVRVEED